MNIRQEERQDYQAVFNLIKDAFRNEVYTDHKEHFLVERLRTSESFVPELSLVAEIDGHIVGYILLTKVSIINDDLQETPSLALAPIAVLQNYRGKGIGGKLIQEAHQRAKELQFSSVVLLGHEAYYPRFGYKMTKQYGIRLPFDVPDVNCMLIELSENALENTKGMVKYAKEFYE